MKQLDFDPVSPPAGSATGAPLLQPQAHLDDERDGDLLVVTSDSDSSSIDDLIVAGAASAKPSCRRRAALDSDSDSEQGALLCTDSSSTHAGLQAPELSSATRQNSRSVYDFSACSPDEESCLEGRLHDRATPASSPEPAKGQQTGASRKVKSRQRSNDVIVLSSSTDDSHDSSVSLKADASELSRYVTFSILMGIITAKL